MSLAAKKMDIVEWVLSIQNEAVLDDLSQHIRQIEPQNGQSDDALLFKYKGEIEEKADLEKIKREQGFTGIDKAKMTDLARQANIEEPLEDLLNMLTP